MSTNDEIKEWGVDLSYDVLDILSTFQENENDHLNYRISCIGELIDFLLQSDNDPNLDETLLNHLRWLSNFKYELERLSRKNNDNEKEKK